MMMMMMMMMIMMMIMRGLWRWETKRKRLMPSVKMDKHGRESPSSLALCSGDIRSVIRLPGVCRYLPVFFLSYAFFISIFI